ncbi:DUF257 family protein [Thermococcus sp. GR6]|uniref:DUF257 family protein n=1 Tax=Thermococcus sp. GR6 TaxID=1638256 RepID=UPI00142F415C|nr:DUF257 family protein [Thermococcus sp. GR6]NJE42365.1 hypothetical protein [Thermococcus sp. GR6]
MKALEDFVRSFEMGETVTVELSSCSPLHLIFYSALKSAQEEGMNVLILDGFDRLAIIVQDLKSVGIDVDLDNLDVIKGGGTLRTGNIIAHIDVSHDERVYIRKYRDTFRRYLSSHSKTVLLVLGLEEFIVKSSAGIRDEMFFMDLLRSFLNVPQRIAVYFINPSLISERARAQVEELSTRVISVECSNGILVKIKKSIKPEEQGVEILVPMDYVTESVPHQGP